MKGKDILILLLILVLSLIMGFLFFDKEFDSYSDIITFLSILLGFNLTSISILFNSRVINLLFKDKNKLYRTELHKLNAYFKTFLYFGLISIIFLILFPDKITLFSLNIYRNYFVYPILFGSFYCIHKIAKDIFRIFVIPRNENKNN